MTQQNSDTVAAGNVISQTPLANASVAPGSAVNLVVSIGPANVNVPNVVGLSQTVAANAITGAKLMVGSITIQNSDTVAAGNIISQTPVANSSVAPGTTVNLVVSAGSSSSPTPTALNLTLEKYVVNGGDSVAFAQQALDNQGHVISPLPATSCSVTANAGSTGTTPSLSGDSVVIPADAKGSFTLTCTLQAAPISGSAGLVILRPLSLKTVNGQSVPRATTTAALYSNFSKALLNLNGGFAALRAALQANDTTGIANARNTLLGARNSVGKAQMRRSYPLALLQGGFPPSLGQIQARGGLGPVAADAQYQSALANLIAKIEQITTFIKGLDPLNLTDPQATQLNQLITDLTTLQTQFRALSPSAYAVVQNAAALHRLLGQSYPELLYALVNTTDSALVLNKLVAAPLLTQEQLAAALPDARSPEDLYGSVEPAFFGLIDLIAGESIIGTLINQIYGPAIQYLENAMILLAAQGLLAPYGGNNVGIEGIVTGASLSFHIFNAPDSLLYGNGFNPDARSNDIWLVGPDHLNAARDIIDLFKTVPSLDLRDLESVEDFFESVWDAVQTAGEVAQRTSQPPDSAQFVDFGILCDNCWELSWNQGFNSVYSTGGLNIPSPVLFIGRNLAVGGFSIASFNFLRAAPRE